MALFIVFNITTVIILIFLFTSHIVIEYLGNFLPLAFMSVFFISGSFYITEGFLRNNFLGLTEVLFGFLLVISSGFNIAFLLQEKHHF